MPVSRMWPLGVCAAVILAVIVVATDVGRSRAAPNDTVADRVYGQTNFTSNTSACVAPSATTLCNGGGIALDPASGALYVTDSANNRVLEYDTPLTNPVPQRVFGQNGSFNTRYANNNASTNAGGFDYPNDVTVDSKGNLYVADFFNNRVLEFNNPLANDTLPDLVIGQTSFTSNAPGLSATQMEGPYGLAVDSKDNLYVSDRNNNRVLEFNTPLTTDTTADRVFGQGPSGANFTSGAPNNGGVSATSINFPEGMAFDASDNLYLADGNNNRILVYVKPLSTDVVADRVIGQGASGTNLTSNVQNYGGVGPVGISFPTDVAVDATGNVYASETGNERVLEYDNPFTTDYIADQVFGQPSFSAFGGNSAGLNASSLADGWSVAIDAQCHLFVDDFSNSRVLEYDNPPPQCALAATATPTGTACPMPFCTPTNTPTPIPPTPTPGCLFPPGCTPTATEVPCSPPPGPCTPTVTLTPGGPTSTPTPHTGLVKVPEGNANNTDLSIPAANLYVCSSYPAAPCNLPNEGHLRVVEHASGVTTGDQNGDTLPDGVGAYEFMVEYDPFVISSLNPCDIVFGPGGAGAARGPVDELNSSAINPDCTPDPNALNNGTCTFSLILENEIKFGCTTNGPLPPGPNGSFDVASLDLIPNPNLANDIFPGNNNGVLTVIKDNGCELADVFGHPVTGSVNGGLLPVCGDLAVTVRILEGDLNLDCKVDVTDQQLIAFRFGSVFGSLLYSKWFDLEPALHDLDIDIKDLQKVFGRDGSTCQNPIPAQPPLPPPFPFP